MHQLSYHSKATKTITEKELKEILAVASYKNGLANISGCLIFHNNCFVQILEGARLDVISIYNKIKKDVRHYDLTLLWECEVEKRHFDQWNMLYHMPTVENRKQYVNNLEVLSDLSDKSTAALLTFWAAVRKITSYSED